ncbi:UNVERIFIED_CONTAM: hypothetical protein Sradi_1757100 [Sesamum radiatum]|uniref:Phospholipase-like protein n=1 Tax=Sesamum radiatum TaxID=300843 RepID=A0AAW2TUL4_SESRA
MVKKEEQVDMTPGYSTQPPPEISSGGAIVSSPSAPVDQSDGPNSSIESNSGTMQDSCFDISPEVDAIKSKYGDIDKDCNLKSVWMRKLNLYVVCNVLRELHEKSIDELDIAAIEAFYDVVRDLEKLNIDIGWLRQRLDQIKDAINFREEAKVLNLEKTERAKKVEEKMKEVEELKSKIEKLEDQMARENQMIEKLNGDINFRTSKVQQLQGKPLTDGLI